MPDKSLFTSSSADTPKKGRYSISSESTVTNDKTDCISTTDCTGLIQALPTDESEAASYSSVYEYKPPTS